MTEVAVPHGYTIDTDIDTVDWQQLTLDLRADNFDNGRTPAELKRSFEGSLYRFARVDGDTRVIGKARLLTDGVCNAYVVDVWTATPHRHKGIASAVMRSLLAAVPGQHVALFTEDAIGLYESLGFRPQDVGMSTVVGPWLNRPPGWRPPRD